MRMRINFGIGMKKLGWTLVRSSEFKYAYTKDKCSHPSNKYFHAVIGKMNNISHHRTSVLYVLNCL